MPLALAESITLPDGSVYVGELQDQRFHGEGRLTWPDGAYYEGAFRDGRMHGLGERVWSDGRRYVGEFVEGVPAGPGDLTAATGQQSEGQFDNGQLVSGHQIDAYGTRYEGTFENSLLHGTGKVVTADGQVWEGTFEQGELTGAGTYSDGEDERYEGEFQEWSYHGQGALSSNNRTYTGDFQHGMFHGQGVLETAEGMVIEGDFEWGQPSGRMTVTYANGDHYVGYLMGEQRHGQGELTLAESGDTISGQWFQDEQRFQPTGEYQSPAAERALYTQTDLLEKSLQQIAQGDPEQTELYFLGVAGDGSQRVFEREVLFAQQLLEREFQAVDRTQVLINSHETSDEFALATITSITRALEAIAEKMNPEDILFVYMTSHGSRDHQLSLKHPEIELTDLPASHLATVLADLPVQHKIIGISACFSGGFIPELKDPNTLIFTAARADRTSFGCSDDNDFTFFGRAFFEQALPQTHSFRYAFHQAYDLVSEWEKAEGYQQSEPQLHAPEPILSVVDAWLSGLDSYQTPQVSDTAKTRYWLRETVQSVAH
ncbi:hypothetical protein MED297_05189 [Reinekea sp. MED297]|uniref:MORN repeat family protein n=1 Tax=Reinekea blandensis MED297 TaxID=314283 RepID=A4BJ59_9GAMM|nr:hypothetical protein MED297_05189 [Reinekea sp. MED297] [Reinekea blandensis MED297]